MGHYAGIFFDILLLAALGFAVHHAMRLSRQFDRMQADRKAFEQLIQALNLASGRAEGAVRTLKEAAQGAGDALQEKITAARGLAGELEIMIQAGDSLAERLTAAAQQRGAAKAAAPEEPASAQPRTRAEKELLEAMKAKQQS